MLGGEGCFVSVHRLKFDAIGKKGRGLLVVVRARRMVKDKPSMQLPKSYLQQESLRRKILMSYLSERKARGGKVTEPSASFKAIE
mmetsp:Transcript_17764/g.40726  ORF Transcript_17764/g.40726 Transcript_17764/m.40726 type:complete len:85 (-) Transcript_17764:79-333(-)